MLYVEYPPKKIDFYVIIGNVMACRDGWTGGLLWHLREMEPNYNVATKGSS